MISPGEALTERPVWRKVEGLWQPLYGGFTSRGVSIEWHDFRIENALAWSQSFHQSSLEICVNYTGSAELREGRRIHHLEREQVAVYTTRDELLNAIRTSDSIHRFLTLEFSAAYLRSQFTAMLEGLKPEVLRFLENPDRFSPWFISGALPSHLLGIRHALLEPPVNESAMEIWYHGKTLEILAQTVFRPDKPAELFCHRHKRLNSERVERVKYLLERDLENPPSLEMLGGEVACSPFYLSRLFAEELGMSIPKYIRIKRVERAAELMVGQGMNVTDAAMAVGYSSLSAFHKAFQEHFGMSPGNYGQRLI